MSLKRICDGCNDSLAPSVPTMTVERQEGAQWIAAADFCEVCQNDPLAACKRAGIFGHLRLTVKVEAEA